jgi:hypothetical protein
MSHDERDVEIGVPTLKQSVDVTWQSSNIPKLRTTLNFYMLGKGVSSSERPGIFTFQYASIYRRPHSGHREVFNRY